MPEDGLKRASCDIVLVIDVSGSMEAAAPLPDVEDEIERDSAGLSILDLTKHAARTILKTLDSKDRLGIVTFSDDAKVGLHFPLEYEMSILTSDGVGYPGAHSNDFNLEDNDMETNRQPS